MGIRVQRLGFRADMWAGECEFCQEYSDDNVSIALLCAFLKFSEVMLGMRAAGSFRFSSLGL